jgi:hypothetical protein
MVQRVQQEMIPALEDLATQHGFGDVDVDGFRSREASREHNWEADPKGTDYIRRLRAMCGRLRVGKDFLHARRLVGAAMCSACWCGSHDRWP